jgi:hypothetical protein
LSKLADTFASLDAMSLEELDERAALQRRVDHKYLVSSRNLDELLSGLRDATKFSRSTGLLVERDPDPPLGERLAEAVQPL